MKKAISYFVSEESGACLDRRGRSTILKAIYIYIYILRSIVQKERLFRLVTGCSRVPTTAVNADDRLALFVTIFFFFK